SRTRSRSSASSCSRPRHTSSGAVPYDATSPSAMWSANHCESPVRQARIPCSASSSSSGDWRTSISYLLASCLPSRPYARGTGRFNGSELEARQIELVGSFEGGQRDREILDREPGRVEHRDL